MMARAIGILLAFTLILSVGWACEKGQADQLSARQGLDELLNENSYPINPWVSPYYYNLQPRVPFAGYANPYQGRIPLNRRPASGYFPNINPYEDNSQESRLAFGTLGALFNAGLFTNLFTPANTFRPFANLVNRMEACTSPSGDAGHCASASACTALSGRPSGSCTQGRVCCINVVTSCGGSVTMNNTYWQSPASVTVPSTCALTVKLDTKLAEQAANPICQIRLDFVSFTTQQPTAGICTADTFTVGGSSTAAPTICGENAGQHMYLDVPSSATSPSDVQLIFNFASGTATRSWNIKIAMLPCGATYLAPKDCLQYFTGASGKVSSFNWQDVATGPTRQLNNQNYNICFRSELVSSKPATQMCVSICTGVVNGDAFSITTPTSVDVANAQTDLTDALDASPQVPDDISAARAALLAAQNTAALNSDVGTTNADGDQATCLYDFLLIAGGREAATGLVADRYCGGALNPKAGRDTSVPVCTSMRPFRMTYQTDNTEGPVNTATGVIAALSDTTTGVPGNTGFCLTYQEQ